ncbi:histidine--tRNA ligase [Bacteriovorax sp. Seq25_V]|uniref:histidine--tRNA ligase n=1 Tax=Bacteriovorax sp. Seq25_V TaxID=1201288 RepID=UPI00038A07F0|nr:histidine--tRNA ligase [Bacteriovorax sp. Seq25_V]EQC43818.1 histidine--tRNA ligase [Bacteriovorax sp. Seq25_V]
MSTIKPQNAKGTRDFGPIESNRRNFIFSTIRKHFESFGFMPLETPSVENLDVLTGKYGEEGDKLLFKILNSGDYLAKAPEDTLAAKDSRGLTRHISDRGLRYDLTVPFARYVSKNQNDLAFPFKRYQIQPVWRADRPQKGRYREFYQCDADVIGTDSLLCEVDLMQIYENAFADLGISDISIKFNNRKILLGLAEVIGAKEKLTDLTIAIDKLDKIPLEKVFEELEGKGFTKDQLSKINPIFNITGTNDEKIAIVTSIIGNNETGTVGLTELNKVLALGKEVGLTRIDFEPTLARGLDYYTGAIYEVKLADGSMGSIGAGGRYDDLTSVFGVKNLPGIGISFGADRIYDVMEARGLFTDIDNSIDYLIINFDDSMELDYLRLANQIRKNGHSVEIYPSNAKLKKQMSYADKRKVKKVIFFGENEKSEGRIKLKELATGTEEIISISEL